MIERMTVRLNFVRASVAEVQFRAVDVDDFNGSVAISVGQTAGTKAADKAIADHKEEQTKSGYARPDAKQIEDSYEWENEQTKWKSKPNSN